MFLPPKCTGCGGRAETVTERRTATEFQRTVEYEHRWLRCTECGEEFTNGHLVVLSDSNLLRALRGHKTVGIDRDFAKFEQQRAIDRHDVHAAIHWTEVLAATEREALIRKHPQRS